MTNHRPFREVKLQWLQQLSCDRDLSDNARSVALYIVTTHINGHTEKAWPSYQTIAEATGKSVKTIQRAIRELEDKNWFDVRRGNGTGHNTEYRPSAFSIVRASEAREKTDRIVSLRTKQGGQIRTQRQSDLSGKGGQMCPPNPEKDKIYKLNAREEAKSRPERQSAVPLVFVPAAKTVQIDHWRSWLRESRLPDIDALSLKTVVGGRSGYSLPGYWPPGDAAEGRLSTIAFLRQRHDHLANCLAGQTDMSRAS